MASLGEGTGNVPQNISVNLIDSYGICLITTIVAAALWGLNVMQTLVFFISPQGDSKTIKGLVLWLMGCETVRLILTIRGLLRILVFNWGDLGIISTILSDFVIQNVFYAIVTVSAQAFFIHRIYVFMGRAWWILPPAALCLAWELAGPLTFMGVTAHDKTNFEIIKNHTANSLVYSIEAVNLLVDVCIAGILPFTVLRNNSGISRKVDVMLIRLIGFTICTGLLTAVVEFSIVLSMFVVPHSLTYFALEFLISGLYVTSVLANLNARPWIRYGKPSATSNSTSSGTSHVRVLSSSGWKDMSITRDISITRDVNFPTRSPV